MGLRTVTSLSTSQASNKPETKKQKREKGKGEKRKTEKQQKTLGTQSEKGLELKL